MREHPSVHRSMCSSFRPFAILVGFAFAVFLHHTQYHSLSYHLVVPSKSIYVQYRYYYVRMILLYVFNVNLASISACCVAFAFFLPTTCMYLSRVWWVPSYRSSFLPRCAVPAATAVELSAFTSCSMRERGERCLGSCR